MNSMNLLIAAFATLLVGVMLLGTVATQTYDVTGGGIAVINETVDTSSTRCCTDGMDYMNNTIAITTAHKGVKCSNGEGGWISGSMTIMNASGKVLRSDNYTIDYANSTIYFKNTSTTSTAGKGEGFFNFSNNTLITYEYYPEGYLCYGWNRAALNLVPGFFGLAILFISLALFYQVAKQEGILDKL